MHRRLTTILAADLVGYSRLIAADEEATIERFRAVVREVFDPTMERHNGRTVKTMGDGLLIEFASPVEAVRAAIAIQQAMATRDPDTPKDGQLQFRIGINLGDVVIDGQDLLGDSVNIAARLEGLAPAGGICLSRTVHEQAKGRIDREMTALGPQSLKNIPEPVDVWQIDLDVTKQPANQATPAPAPRAAQDRPSIAVLPFENLSSDPDQAFLVDGLVADVVTSLSRFRWLVVISRNSTAAFKDASMDAREIARELNVRYVVEGSVRRAGERLRVSFQLIDGETGSHVLADRFDRSMTDLFDLQDQLAQDIIAALVPEIDASERLRCLHKPANDLTAWELYQRSLAEFYSYTPEGIGAAKALALRATETDPTMASPYALLTRIACSEHLNGSVPDPAASLQDALSWAEHAVKCDPRSDDAHGADGFALLVANRLPEAIRALEKAIALNPNNANLRLNMCMALLSPGIERSAEALEHIKKALILSPADPFLWTHQAVACIACTQMGDLAQASQYLEMYRGARQADWKCLLGGALCDVLSGRDDDAAAMIKTAQERAAPLRLSLQRAQHGLPALFALPSLNDAAQRLVVLGLDEH